MDTLEKLADIVKEAIVEARKERDTAITHKQAVEELKYSKRIIRYSNFLNYLYKEMKEELEEQERMFDPKYYKRL